MAALFLVLATLALQTTAVARPNPQPLELQYHLRVVRPSTHLVDVEIVAGKVTEPTLDFIMPAWSPGRYAIYDFAKNVQEFEATGADGHPLPWSNTDKQTWRVETAGSGGTLRVRYKVFGNDLNGSFSQIDSTHANLNGASAYMYVAGHKPDPVALTVEAPNGWKVYSGFSLKPDERSFRAPNYDRLIDTPMEISPECQVEQFSAGGKTIRVMVHDYEPEEDAEAAGQAAKAASPAASPELTSLVEGVKRIVASEIAMMPEPDFPHYTFLFHFAPDLNNGGDGMEHLNSTEIIVRGSLDGEGIREAEESAAHEFFHLWNVKRLRPAALGPFDYTREDYSRSLWFAEGVTSYYAYVHLRRSGVWDEREFLKHLADEVRALELEPGRALMSAESSSFHAWFYDRSPQMQETNFANTTISYYNKGALLGMLLDLEIRGRTGGQKSLDDVLRRMYQQFYEAPARSGSSPASYYASGPGYEERDIVNTLNSVAGGDWGSFFERYVEGTAPLPYAETLARAGLVLRIATEPGAPPDLGAAVQPVDRGVRITAIRPGGAADRAGLERDDVLVAVDELSLATEDLPTRLKMYPSGAEVPFTVERHARRFRITVKLDPPVVDEYSIEEAPQATPEQLGIRKSWLGK
ncbi:MAG TPA: PDZ domain-containing protein [Terriglobia bacterium]|nr:PDZ domain-containing protein [Terriglobia bacterium]